MKFRPIAEKTAKDFRDILFALPYSWSHAVATRSRWRRGYGFNGKGGVSGARKYDGQLLTALCGGSWTSEEWMLGCRAVDTETREELCVVHSC